MPASVRVIGLMSGTSLDGVDGALVEFGNGPPRLLTTAGLPYPQDIRQRALRLQAAADHEIDAAARLANDLARLYADVSHQLLAQSGLGPSQIAAIGCHGQTIRHQPAAAYSVQIQNPALLAELTGITVVADFRSRDIAAGGQGAPLVPAFHQAVFGDAQQHRVIINLGGIANITDLAAGKPVTGFDCGPANVLLDAWVELHRGLRYDAAGAWAAQGRLIPELLASLKQHPFFAAPPPKSCGRDEFHLAWLNTHLSGTERPQDVQATLSELSAQALADAIQRWCGAPARALICGGGSHNADLLARLAAHLPGIDIGSTAELGIAPEWVEAAAFAWLAWRTLQGLPGNLPAVTGASGPRILGAIYPA